MQVIVYDSVLSDSQSSISISKFPIMFLLYQGERFFSTRNYKKRISFVTVQPATVHLCLCYNHKSE